MTHLSVNINKIATIRNARGGNIPDVVLAAVRIQSFGADGITVHPRPDGRHIREDDVYQLRKVITTEFNIEGNPIEHFMKLVTAVIPEQVTLVPDAHDAITSNSGWDTISNKSFLTDIVEELKKYGIRVSIFVDPVIAMIEAAAETGADRIELYTEPYASHYSEDPHKAVLPYVKAAEAAIKCGMGINAGHDLNLQNLRFFKENMPQLDEVSIGHALISDALYMGLENTVKAYKACLQ
jgi:pyridoxine 5-phosphate synthase